MSEEDARERLINKMRSIYQIGVGDGLAGGVMKKKGATKKKAVTKKQSTKKKVTFAKMPAKRKTATKKKKPDLAFRKVCDKYYKKGQKTKKGTKAKSKRCKQYRKELYRPSLKGKGMDMDMDMEGYDGSALIDQYGGVIVDQYGGIIVGDNEYGGCMDEYCDYQGNALPKRRKCSPKNSGWIERVKEYSQANGISYKQAMMALKGT